MQGPILYLHIYSALQAQCVAAKVSALVEVELTLTYLNN